MRFTSTSIVAILGIIAGSIMVLYDEPSAGTTVISTTIGSYFAYMRGEDNTKSDKDNDEGTMATIPD